MIAPGRWWLLGASTGIGAQLARQMAAAGHSLVLSSRNGERLEALRAGLESAQRHLVLPWDVLAPGASARAQLRGLLDGEQPLNLLFNAGYYEPQAARDFDTEVMQRIAATNFNGVLEPLGLLLPHWHRLGRGHLVMVSSAAAYGALPNSLVYGASKAALSHLGLALRLDLASAGVLVQVAHPGFVDTGLTAKNDFYMPAMLSARQAAQRILRGMARGGFDISFPRRLCWPLRALAALPVAWRGPLLRLLRPDA